MTTKAQQILALEFIDSQQHPKTDFVEDQRKSAFSRSINEGSNRDADLLIEHLRDYVSAATRKDQYINARLVTELLIDLVTSEVTQWNDFEMWLRECARPCGMTQFKTQRDAAY